MNRIFQRILALVGIVILPMGIANADQHEFSIVVLPDIQTYTAKRPQILEAQIKWITDNKDGDNIIYVSQLGDLKDVGRGATGCINGTIAWPGPGSATSTEWQIVRRAFDQLDVAGIPYGVSPGNHDFDSGNYPANTGGCPNYDSQRPLLGYNDEFPPSSFPPATDEYGPRTAFSNEDNYVTASSNGVDFLFINLGYQEEAPAAGSTDSIDWAEIQLTNFPNHLAIVTSHNLVDCNKAPSRPQISGNGPCVLGTADQNQLSTYGANIVDRLRGYRNLFMLIGGHRFGEAYLQVDRSATSSGAEGFPPVHAVLANYQHMGYSATQFADVTVDGPPSGSSGYFKLMEFDMGDMTVDMVAISPALAANSGNTAAGAFPVLSNTARAAAVRSTRNIDVNNPGDLIDGNGVSTLHDRSVSNLNNISFDGYVTVTPTTTGSETLIATSANELINPSSIFSVDTATGVATLIGAPANTPNGISDITVNPVDGRVYALHGGSAKGAELVELDPQTATVLSRVVITTSVADFRGSGALAFDDAGTLYVGAWAQGRLMVVNPATGVASSDIPLSGGGGNEHIADLAWDRTTGELWASRGGSVGAVTDIQLIDPATGGVSQTIALGGTTKVTAIAIDQNGTMYASFDGNRLATVDRATGAVTLVGSGFGGQKISGLGFVPVP